MKKILIHNGNISIGGQEKMLIEFLNILDPMKYEVLLLIEEDNGERNDYIDLIPSWVKYRFLTSKNFMSKIEKSKKSKNILSKLYYSILLKLKKKIAIKNLKEYLDFSNIIIDYDMGLLRNLDKLNLKDKKIIGWSHAGIGQVPKNRKKRKNIEKYNYIVVINEIMKEGYLRNYKNLNVVKIYNFMDFDLIWKKAEESLERNYEEYIVSIGSLTKNKNHELLIDAFKILKEKYNIKEKLLIIGDGKEKNNLKEKIEKLSLEEEIYLLGQKNNPYKYIKNSILFVLSSISEGLPLTLIESMCLRKMVISTINSGSVEIIGDNKYGQLVKISANKLAEKIYFYLQNDLERKKYEELGFKRATDFNKETGKKVIEEFLDTL